MVSPVLTRVCFGFDSSIEQAIDIVVLLVVSLAHAIFEEWLSIGADCVDGGDGEHVVEDVLLRLLLVHVCGHLLVELPQLMVFIGPSARPIALLCCTS